MHAMNLPEIHRLTADEMRKLFPSKYYSKYQYHTKVVEHESSILNQSVNERDQLGHKSNHNQQSIPQVPSKKLYNPRFENYQSTILLNKQQVGRLSKYSRALDMKLQKTPQKKPNMIRSPIKFHAEASQSLLDKLKAIQDINFDYQLKHKQLKKKILQKKSLCKFIRKIKSTQISPRKDESPQTKRQDPQLKKQKSSQQSYSQSLPQIQNPNNKIKIKAKFLNLKMITNFQKKDQKPPRYFQSDQNDKNLCNKIDLLQETRKIKKQVYSMETLSLYQVQQMKKRRLSTKNTIQ